MCEKRLILMRHAETDGSGRSDHHRPLSFYGRRSLGHIAAQLRARSWIPDQALSSDARRTRESWEGLQFPAEVIWRSQLYLASAGTIIKELSTLESGETVLLLGHNPGIAEAAERLCRQKFYFEAGQALLLRREAESWEEAMDPEEVWKQVAILRA